MYRTLKGVCIWRELIRVETDRNANGYYVYCRMGAIYRENHYDRRREVYWISAVDISEGRLSRIFRRI